MASPTTSTRRTMVSALIASDVGGGSVPGTSDSPSASSSASIPVSALLERSAAGRTQRVQIVQKGKRALVDVQGISRSVLIVDDDGDEGWETTSSVSNFEGDVDWDDEGSDVSTAASSLPSCSSSPKASASMRQARVGLSDKEVEAQREAEEKAKAEAEAKAREEAEAKAKEEKEKARKEAEDKWYDEAAAHLRADLECTSALIEVLFALYRADEVINGTGGARDCALEEGGGVHDEAEKVLKALGGVEVGSAFVRHCASASASQPSSASAPFSASSSETPEEAPSRRSGIAVLYRDASVACTLAYAILEQGAVDDHAVALAVEEGNTMPEVTGCQRVVQDEKFWGLLGEE